MILLHLSPCPMLNVMLLFIYFFLLIKMAEICYELLLQLHLAKWNATFKQLQCLFYYCYNNGSFVGGHIGKAKAEGKVDVRGCLTGRIIP
jgi:hypothetical protein